MSLLCFLDFSESFVLWFFVSFFLFEESVVFFENDVVIECVLYVKFFGVLFELLVLWLVFGEFF